MDLSDRVNDIEWVSAVDRNIALLTTYRHNWKEWLRTKQQPYKEKAKKALFLLHQYLQQGGYEQAIFTEHRDDSVEGGFRGTGPVDEYFDYSKTSQTALFIKEMSVRDAWQTFKDSLFSRSRFRRDLFYLAEADEPMEYDDNQALIVTKFVLGPNISDMFTTLNAEIKKGNADAEKIKSMIIQKNLEDLILWQSCFHETMPPEIASVQTIPQTIAGNYVSNIESAIRNAEKFTYAKPNLNFVVSDAEWGLIALGLGIFKRLRLSEDRIARTLDNSDTNSGLELGRVKFENDEERYKALLDAISEPSSHAPTNRVISMDKLNSLYAHFDTATGRFGQFLEDFYHMIDSYSLGINESEKDVWYNQFLIGKFGREQAAIQKQEKDIDEHLIRFYRNLRRRDLIISRFARNNEQMHMSGRRSDNEHQQKRDDYTQKASHRMRISLQPLNRAIAYFDEKYDRPPDYDLVTSGLGSIAKSLVSLQKKLGKTSYPELQRELDGYAIEIANKLKSTPHMARTYGELIALTYTSIKMSFFNRIRFDRLQNQ